LERENSLVTNTYLGLIGLLFFLALGVALMVLARREGRSLGSIALLATALCCMLLALYFMNLWFGAFPPQVLRMFLVIALLGFGGGLLSWIALRQRRK